MTLTIFSIKCNHPNVGVKILQKKYHGNYVSTYKNLTGLQIFQISIQILYNIAKIYRF